MCDDILVTSSRWDETYWCNGPTFLYVKTERYELRIEPRRDLGISTGDHLSDVFGDQSGINNWEHYN